jgi:hypothetical protein
MYERAFLDKFIGWLNDWKDPNVFESAEERGLREDAPEGARQAYAEYLESERRARENGKKY